MIWYHNQDQFEDLKFGEESVNKVSRYSVKTIDLRTPSWMQTMVDISHLNDESSLIQLGGGTEKTLYSMESDKILNSSTHKNFPTDQEPDNTYIFTSLYVGQGKDLTRINRRTYNLLDWLGDWGGLLDGLKLITGMLLSPLSNLALNSRLVQTFARVKSPRSQTSREE